MVRRGSTVRIRWRAPAANSPAKRGSLFAADGNVSPRSARGALSGTVSGDDGAAERVIGFSAFFTSCLTGIGSPGLYVLRLGLAGRGSGSCETAPARAMRDLLALPGPSRLPARPTQLQKVTLSLSAVLRLPHELQVIGVCRGALHSCPLVALPQFRRPHLLPFCEKRSRGGGCDHMPTPSEQISILIGPMKRVESSAGDSDAPARAGARMTVYEMVRLGLTLAAARSGPHPIPWDTLERKLGIPKRTLQHNHMRHQERAESQLDGNGERAVQESFHLYTELMRRTAEVIDDADNSAARIGAIRTMIDLIERRMSLLNLLSARAEYERGALLIEDFGRFLERADISLEVTDELLAIVDSRQRSRGVQPA
jgi:hypothetical protein